MDVREILDAVREDMVEHDVRIVSYKQQVIELCEQQKDGRILLHGIDFCHDGCGWTYYRGKLGITDSVSHDRLASATRRGVRATAKALMPMDMAILAVSAEDGMLYLDLWVEQGDSVLEGVPSDIAEYSYTGLLEAVCEALMNEDILN